MTSFGSRLIGALLLTVGIGGMTSAANADGDLARRPTRLEPLVLGDGEENDFAISRAEIRLKTGVYYMLPVEAKGYKEYRFEAPEFFQNIWVNQVVVEDLEVHTTHIDALEFDDQGTMELWFIALRTGEFGWSVEDFGEKGMQGRIIVE